MAVIKALTVELGLVEYGRLLDDLEHAMVSYRNARDEYYKSTIAHVETQTKLNGCLHSVMQLEAEAEPAFGAKVLMMRKIMRKWRFTFML